MAVLAVVVGGGADDADDDDDAVGSRGVCSVLTRLRLPSTLTGVAVEGTGTGRLRPDRNEEPAAFASSGSVVVAVGASLQAAAAASAACASISWRVGRVAPSRSRWRMHPVESWPMPRSHMMGRARERASARVRESGRRATRSPTRSPTKPTPASLRPRPTRPDRYSSRGLCLSSGHCSPTDDVPLG